MKKKYIIIIGGIAVAAAGVLLLRSQKTIPANARAIKDFNKKKYLGKWYEIARLDYKYERHLSDTTAEYFLNDDGSIKVVNKGYDYKNNKWKQATGKAKFLDKESEARLKVSFFGPFYAGYNVIALDYNYNYALVAGKNLNYLWLLSRKPAMPEAVKDDFLAKAAATGYDITKLVWVKHNV